MARVTKWVGKKLTRPELEEIWMRWGLGAHTRVLARSYGVGEVSMLYQLRKAGFPWQLVRQTMGTRTVRSEATRRIEALARGSGLSGHEIMLALILHAEQSGLTQDGLAELAFSELKRLRLDKFTRGKRGRE